LIELRKAEINSELPLPSSSIPTTRLDNIANETTTMTATIEKELDEAGNDALRERQKELLNSLDLRKFVIVFVIKVPDSDVRLFNATDTLLMTLRQIGVLLNNRWRKVASRRSLALRLMSLLAEKEKWMNQKVIIVRERRRKIGGVQTRMSRMYSYIDSVYFTVNLLVIEC
jgi:Mg2+ and Co2+ transporter CorA